MGYDISINLEPEKVENFRAGLCAPANLDGNVQGMNSPILFMHNVQSVTAIAFMGLFSFGVLGIVLYMVNIGQISLLFGLAQRAGFDAGPVTLSFFVAHGIFEIPAIIISSAAVFYIGLTLVTPNTHRTLGEVVIEAMADWFKVLVGIVAPLLVIASMIETYVTSQLIIQSLSIACK
jgi:stage II sporulation protein M